MKTEREGDGVAVPKQPASLTHTYVSLTRIFVIAPKPQTQERKNNNNTSEWRTRT